eukprot:228059-Pleurochrysis_carterae.AAC.1
MGISVQTVLEQRRHLSRSAESGQEKKADAVDKKEAGAVDRRRERRPRPSTARLSTAERDDCPARVQIKSHIDRDSGGSAHQWHPAEAMKRCEPLTRCEPLHA